MHTISRSTFETFCRTVESDLSPTFWLLQTSHPSPFPLALHPVYIASPHRIIAGAVQQ